MKISDLILETDLEMVKENIITKTPKCEFCDSNMVYEASERGYWVCQVCKGEF